MLHRFPKIFERNRPRPMMGGMEYMIVGLGNPGKEYDGTRHNVGFLAVDEIAKEAGAEIKRLKFQSLCGEAVIEGQRVLLLKPSTFMNLSGQAVKAAADFYKIPPEKILVFCDDVALDPGRLRVRRQGTDGGHNGIKNIIYLLGSDQFPRVKIGVGEKPHPDYDLAKWVLSRPTGADATAIQTAVEKAGEIARLIVKGRIDEAMNEYNVKA